MIRSITLMGTSVTIQIAADESDVQRSASCEDAISRAFEWFTVVESCCSRFDPSSELMQLVSRVGDAVPASDMLFELVQFAQTVAAETDGAFDPTVGGAMAARGFARNYRTGAVVHSPAGSDTVSYRDVHVDTERRTITIARPLVLDLGAVAKGMAIDLAARELHAFTNFAIDAGGDLYAGGHAAPGRRWSVGIRHPRLPDQTIATLCVSNAAVCTSGDYERTSPESADQHHILDPRSGRASAGVASVTVVAPTAMAADALATAAFVLGPECGREFLERHGVEGLIITPALERIATQGFHSDHGFDEVLPHSEGTAHDRPHRARDPVGLG